MSFDCIENCRIFGVKTKDTIFFMTEKDIKIVELRVNGRQAAEQLWELKKRVKEWEQQKNCTNR